MNDFRHIVVLWLLGLAVTVVPKDGIGLALVLAVHRWSSEAAAFRASR